MKSPKIKRWRFAIAHIESPIYGDSLGVICFHGPGPEMRLEINYRPQAGTILMVRVLAPLDDVHITIKVQVNSEPITASWGGVGGNVGITALCLVEDEAPLPEASRVN